VLNKCQSGLMLNMCQSGLIQPVGHAIADSFSKTAQNCLVIL